jgi:hypothetical protein
MVIPPWLGRQNLVCGNVVYHKKVNKVVTLSIPAPTLSKRLSPYNSNGPRRPTLGVPRAWNECIMWRLCLTVLNWQRQVRIKVSFIISSGIIITQQLEISYFSKRLPVFALVLRSTSFWFHQKETSSAKLYLILAQLPFMTDAISSVLFVRLSRIRWSF